MAKIQFDPKDEPYIESEPFGTCDWGGCDEEAVRWRWANEMTAHLPVCLAHSLEAEVATLTTERDHYKRFAAHRVWCHKPRSDDREPCNCGFERALAGTGETP